MVLHPPRVIDEDTLSELRLARGQADLIFITIIMGRFAAWQTARCSLGLLTTLERS